MNEHELVKEVFHSPSGEDLLAMWKQYYGDRISFDPLNTPEQTAYREGERAFLMAIIYNLEHDNDR